MSTKIPAGTPNIELLRAVFDNCLEQAKYHDERDPSRAPITQQLVESLEWNWALIQSAIRAEISSAEVSQLAPGEKLH